MFRKMTVGVFAILLAGVVAYCGDSHIVVDRTAPGPQQPHVVSTAGGLPQVNIATPNSGGMSYNRYQQFDVGRSGAILNNSGQNVNTQLGGWIEGNPNLARGGANLIVNEVNSSRPSQLHGYIEVAGQRADVVIANPSGISVDGGGFINANRATLTTGRPVIEDGILTGYQVNGGHIDVLGGGLNNEKTNFTDIIARSVTVNAKIHASNELNVITGENFVSRDTSNVTRNDPDAETGLTVDVGSLGGMYAGQIRLVGTGRGVGVNSIQNSGEIYAGIGEVIINNDGMLMNAGMISGQDGVAIAADDGAENTGAIQTGGDIVFSALNGSLVNSGTIIGDSEIEMFAGSSIVNSGDILAKDNTNLTALEGSIDNQGRIVGGETLDMVAGVDIRNEGGIEGGMSLKLDAITGVIESAGVIVSGGSAEITALRDIVNTGDIESAGYLIVESNAGSVDNQKRMLGGDRVTVMAKTNVLNSGDLQSGGILTLIAEDSELVNTGALQSAGGFILKINGDFDNIGTIRSGGDLSISAVTGWLRNSGSLFANGKTELSSLLDLVNTGTLKSFGAITARSFAGGFSNTNEVLSNALINIVSKLDFSNGGLIQGLGDVSANSENGQWTNTGDVISGGDLVLSGYGAVDNAGLLQSANSMTVVSHTRTFTNADEILAGSALSITSISDLVNDGLLQGGQTTTLTSRSGAFINRSTVMAGGTLNILADLDSENTAAIQSGGNMAFTVTKGDLRNSGKMVSLDGMGFEVGGRLDNSSDILSNASIVVATGDILENKGTIHGLGNLTIASSGDLVNSGSLKSGSNGRFTAKLGIANTGTIFAKTGILLQASGGDLVNTGNITSGGDAVVNISGRLTNETIFSIGGDITASVGSSVTNSGEFLGGNIFLSNEGLLHNTGTIDGGQVIIRSSAIENFFTGTILGDHLALEADDILNGMPLDQTGTGNAGLIGARDRLDLGASSITNREDGLLFSGGDMSMGGALDANGFATGTATSILNSSAVIDAGGSLHISAQDFTNYNAHYKTEMKELPQRERYSKYSPEGWSILFDRDQVWFGGDQHIYWTYNGVFGTQEDWTQYDLVRVDTDTLVLTSRPGFIYAGSDLTITGGTLTNDKSQVYVGDVLKVEGENFHQIAAMEEYHVDVSGNYYWSEWEDKRRQKHWRGVYKEDTVITLVEKDVVLDGNVPTRYKAGSQVIGGDGEGPSRAESGGTLNPEEIELRSGVTLPDDFDITAAPHFNITLNLNIPLNENMFRIGVSPDSMYLVETNPRLTNYRDWVGSDYMLQRLSVDPATIQKRLGDAYYEQRLVREQIVNKTGARFLDDYSNDEGQYLALMQAGVEFAEEYGLVPGVALSSDLMARLTSDMVWLEYVTVDTAVGPELVLAPKVYLAPGRDSVINPNGTLMVAREVQMDLAGDITNSGAIHGGSSIRLSADNINNSGLVAGDSISLAALRDINNIGGDIVGESSVSMTAGNDITLASAHGESSSSSSAHSAAASYITKVGMVAVTGEGGTLSVEAGRDLTVRAAIVDSAGDATLTAGRDVNVGAISVGREVKGGIDAENGFHHIDYADVGSDIATSGNLTIQAGRDIDVTASLISSEEHLSLAAAGDVTIQEGRAEHLLDQKSTVSHSRTFSKKESKHHTRRESNTAIGSELSGDTVSIESGGDFTLQGSTVAASEGLSVEAGGEIAIRGAENSESTYMMHESKRSGFSGSFGGGRVGISYGTSKKGTTHQTDETWNSGSLIGSENGDVSLYAGKNASITGSQVIAGSGDIAISGENVTIDSAYDTTDSQSHEWYKQKGISLSIGVGGAIGNAINSGLSTANTIERSQNAMTDRAGTLFGIAAARDAYDTGKAIQQVASNGGVANSGNIGLSVEIGFSSTKSESKQESHASNVAGSYIQSGGDTTIIARGREGEAGTGDLTIIGSEVHAGGKVILDAANDLSLLSAEDTYDFSSSNKSSSFGIGGSIGIGVGSGGAGLNLSVNANASSSKGSGQGSEVRHTETIIHGDDGVDFTSGNDTTLKGAQIIGEHVTGIVGGDLTIASEQDTYNETMNQKSSGGGVSVGWTIGAGGPSVGGNFNSQSQKGNADYASVDEQSGIFAGDGGFDLTVGGNTYLEGAVIASNADLENNSLTTGSITTSDIDNSMSYEASTKGWGGEFTYVKNPDQSDKNANTGSISPGLPMKDKGDDQSTTKSAIAEGSVTITDEDAQLAKTGQTADEAVASLDRDTDNAHNGPLERPPSLEELFAKQAELQEAASLAAKAVATTVGDISEVMYNKTNGDPRWGEGGAYKAILQTAGAALVAQLGNGDGIGAALGTMANQLISGNLSGFINEISGKLTTDPDAQVLIANLLMNIVANGIGSIGGESGASLASIMDRYNRQLHPIYEAKWIIENAKEFADQLKDVVEGDLDDAQLLELARSILMKQALSDVDLLASQEIILDPKLAAMAKSYLDDRAITYLDMLGNQQRMFKAIESPFSGNGDNPFEIVEGDFFRDEKRNPFMNYWYYDESMTADAAENIDLIKRYTGFDVTSAVTDPRFNELYREHTGSNLNEQIAGLLAGGMRAIAIGTSAYQQSQNKIIKNHGENRDVNKGTGNATGFMGREGFELTQPKYQLRRNYSTTVNGRNYSGHALDQMQNRGVPPSVVENTIRHGKNYSVSNGSVGFYDPINNIRVITNSSGKVITVIRGKPKNDKP